MSRYEIKALDPSKHTVFVGWDPMLNTLFGQVYDKDEDEENNPILWVGSITPHIHDVEDLKRKLKWFAKIPYDIEVQLYKDSD